LRESEVKEADESALEPEEESHGVTVGATVVAAALKLAPNFMFAFGGAGVEATASAMPAAMPAAATAAETPMPAFSAVFKPCLPFAAEPTMRLSRTATRKDAIVAKMCVGKPVALRGA